MFIVRKPRPEKLRDDGTFQSKENNATINEAKNATFSKSANNNKLLLKLRWNHIFKKGPQKNPHIFTKFENQLACCCLLIY